MKLEDQVVSLELAKKLKELGVKQESLFWWHDGCSTWATPHIKSEAHSCIGHTFSAFTVAELGEMLPARHIDTMKLEGEWFARYVEVTHNFYQSEFSTTEADARAKLVIFLIEANLITL